MVGAERGEGGLVGSSRTPSKSKLFELNTIKIVCFNIHRRENATKSS